MWCYIAQLLYSLVDDEFATEPHGRTRRQTAATAYALPMSVKNELYKVTPESCGFSQ